MKPCACKYSSVAYIDALRWEVFAIIIGVGSEGPKAESRVLWDNIVHGSVILAEVSKGAVSHLSWTSVTTHYALIRLNAGLYPMSDPEIQLEFYARLP